MSTNAKLLNAAVKLLNGSTSYIERVYKSKQAYKIAGVAEQVPTSHLMRRGKNLVQVEPDVFATLDKNKFTLANGYLHIYTRDQQRDLKRNGAVIVPEPLEWNYVQPKAIEKELPKATKPAAKKPAAKTVKDKKPAARKPVGRTKEQLNAKAKGRKAKVVEEIFDGTDVLQAPVGQVDRNDVLVKTLAETLRNATATQKAWIRNALLAGTEETKLPLVDAAFLVKKFGRKKVTQALKDVREKFLRDEAEKRLPRSLRNLRDGLSMQLTSAQIETVITALAPSMPQELIDVVKGQFKGVNLAAPETKNKDTENS